MSTLRRATRSPLIALALVAGSLTCALTGTGFPDRATADLQSQIAGGRSAVSSLSGAASAAAGRVVTLSGSVAVAERQLNGAEARFETERGMLLRLRAQADAARGRLHDLEASQATDEVVLSRQLLAAYEDHQPDLMTVVLEAKGFKDLLERLSFAARVRHQSVQIVHRVRDARRAVAAQAVRLGQLEVRQQTVTAQLFRERNALARAGAALEGRLAVAVRQRDARRGALAAERARVAGLEHRLARLQAAQAAAAAAAARHSAAPAGPSGGSPPSSGASPAGASGGFTFPLPRSAASAPGSWSLDQGVDISAPGNTPEFAVCAGTIVLHGIGGFGPWAPVLHCDSPLSGYSYVYYGHAGPANQLPVGTHVSAGEAMSSIGPGIVGLSSGPHIEIGFADATGNPVGSGSAPTMMSLLHSSY